MKVLIACEFSGIVRDAFIAKGHNAMSCDLLPTESPGPHYQGDVFNILNDGWDLIIAHPPCTYLSNAGARFLYPKGKLNQDRLDIAKYAKSFFLALFTCNINKIAIENPIPSKIIGLPKYSQIILSAQMASLASLPPGNAVPLTPACEAFLVLTFGGYYVSNKNH